MVEYEAAVVDLSAIKTGYAADLVMGGKVREKVIIPKQVIKRIHEDAERGDFVGVEELKKLRKIAEQVEVEIVIAERGDARADPDIAALEVARDYEAALATSSEIQARMADALGIGKLYGKAISRKELLLEAYFAEDIMSVHLKEGIPPRVKRGKPGSWRLEYLREEPVSREELERVIADLMERVGAGEGFIEVQREGSTIMQVHGYRVVVTRPPFSDKLELTATRPIAKLKLEDYELPPKLIARLEERAEGILIAGAPGMGKTTFAQALAEFYMRKNKVVKTIESPRDLQLPIEATQYSKSRSTSEELHDVLLLSRPDYTIFDEMRDTEDFKIYADLRLAGVGMVGVIHATAPIDAIQRFIGRVELGVIPSIIDTVIFIENGEVAKVYTLETGVKIPHGLTEADLTRPVVIVRDFLTGEPEYEIYVFGEKTFVVPLKPKMTPRMSAAKAMIEKVVGKYVPPDEYEVRFTDRGAVIEVPPERYHVVMKRCRKKLERIQSKLGVAVEVKPRL
ncbi:MAG: Flp pilus assembly complex ATPase component TadA [Candidatus Verstraetearchaeota archaeon]|nr:Flp pilus assembly complex ATPase component TadA [Candidatus Verstraetearchaeota archaeon]